MTFMSRATGPEDGGGMEAPYQGDDVVTSQSTGRG